MEAARANLSQTEPGQPSVEAAETLGAPTVVEEAEVASSGIWTRIKLKMVEMAPVMGRFIEVQAACSCASGCPTCVGATAASIAVPVVSSGRKRPGSDSEVNGP